LSVEGLERLFLASEAAPLHKQLAANSTQRGGERMLSILNGTVRGNWLERAVNGQ